MKKTLLALGLFALPLATFAQAVFNESSAFSNYLRAVITFIQGTLVPLVFAIAFLAFIWGALRYFVWGGADEEKRKEGKNLMIYAIIGFVLMVSIWGIVTFVSRGLGFDDRSIDEIIPKTPGTSSAGGVSSGAGNPGR